MKRNLLIFRPEVVLGTPIPLVMGKTPSRNEKCECGSKLKYKNCCGKKATLALQARMLTVNP